jgi:hypothetical protein
VDNATVGILQAKGLLSSPRPLAWTWLEENGLTPLTEN